MCVCRKRWNMGYILHFDLIIHPPPPPPPPRSLAQRPPELPADESYLDYRCRLFGFWSILIWRFLDSSSFTASFLELFFRLALAMIDSFTIPSDV